MCLFKKSKPDKENTAIVLAEFLPDDKFFKKEGFYKDGEDSGFKNLAELLSSSEEEIKDDCKYYLICKILSSIVDLTTRFAPKEEELIGKVKFLSAVSIGGYSVSPAYIKSFNRSAAKAGKRANIRAIVDFPFGETTFNAKRTEIKNCLRQGIKNITAVIPAILLSDVRALKKQIKSLSRINGDITVAVSAETIDDSGIKNFIKAVNKSGINGGAFIFGETSEKEFDEKFALITGKTANKPVSVIASVKSAKTAVKLLKAGVKEVITPYALDIAKELISAAGFKLK